LPKPVKNVLLIVSSLLIFDIVVAVLGGSYLSENIGTFLGKSRTVILSDLLFLEGTVIFAIGTFIAVAKALQETKPSHLPDEESTEGGKETREKRIHKGILLMIAGAILTGLSIMVGALLP